MTLRTTLVIACALLTSAAPPAEAQVIELPPRPLRGIFGGGRSPDPNRPRQEVASQFNLLGGYDDNLANVTSGGAPFQPGRSGYTGFADALLHYFLGSARKSFDVAGRGYVNTFKNAGLGPMFGGSIMLSGRTTIGRKASLDASQTLRADPFYTLGVFAPLESELGVASPDHNVSNAIGGDRSRSIYTSVRSNYAWTRRVSTEASYSRGRTTYLEGVRSNTRSQSAGAALSQGIGRGTNIRGSYRYQNSDYVQPNGVVTPLTDHNLDIGFSQDRQVSRTRRLAYSFGAGATYTTPLSHGPVTEINKFWTPSGYGSLRVDLWRSWNVSGDLRRGVSVLQGIVPETFLSTAATLRAGGYINSSLEAAVIVGYSDGQVGQGIEGRYESFTSSGQLRIRLTQWWSSLVSYNRYQHTLTNVAASSLGVVPDSNSNSVHVGFTWVVPFFGRYVGQAPAAN